mgnify:CR=1 FL=1
MVSTGTYNNTCLNYAAFAVFVCKHSKRLRTKRLMSIHRCIAVSTSIPEPMDPSLLIGQRIKIERQLLEQPDFQRSLFLEA